MSKPRKRIKVECLECGNQFDDDYKSRHEERQHSGRRVKIQHVGAPLNPFEASKRKVAVSIPATGLLFDVEMSAMVEPPLVVQKSLAVEPPSIVEPSSPVVKPTLLIEPPPLVVKPPIIVEAVKSSHIVEPSSTIQPLLSSKAEFSLLHFAGQVAEFLTNFDRANDVLQKVKNDVVPNSKVFIVEMIDFLSKIHEESGELLEDAKKEEIRIVENSVHLQIDREVSIDHDPGKRKKISSRNERLYVISLGPFQPKLSVFPVNEKVPPNKQCRFNSSWYKDFPMLKYSIQKDAAYCFACSLFPERIGVRYSSPEWVSTGVRQWHKMKSRGTQKKGKLMAHFASESHRAAMNSLCHIINEDGHVDVLLDKSIRQNKIKEVQEREYHKKVVYALLDVARTLGRQGLAFRGSGDSADIDNGNFRQIVNLLSRHCPIIKKWLEEIQTRSHHVSYLSGNAQNEFIDLLGAKTRKDILDEIRQAGVYSVLADTTPDLSHQDRLAINIRYVVDKCGEPLPVERLLKMDVVLTKKTGAELAEKIFTVLNSEGLPLDKIAFQSYDFASNMSGKYNGTQQKLSELCNKTIPYIPCQAHRLNIFVETSCNASTLIREFFNTLETLYIFFSGSTKRYQCFQEELTTIENSLQLKNLSKTRWTARAESVKAVSIAYEHIVHVLEVIKSSTNFDSKTRCSASGLHKKILDFDFICSLFFSKNIMFKIKNLTELLEAEKLNVIDAMQLFQSTLISFREINDDQKIAALIESSVIFARKLDVNPENDFFKHHRTRHASKKYDENSKTTAEINFLSFYRKEFRIILDVLTSSFQENLEKIVLLLKPFHEIFIIPANRNNCTIELVESIVKTYSEIIKEVPESLQAELQILLDACQESTNFEDISKVAFRLRNVIPKAYKIIHLILTSPVSSASCERSFSKLKLIYNHLRTTMDDDRLNSLMLLFSAKDKVDKIDIHSIVNQWSQMKHRRIKT